MQVLLINDMVGHSKVGMGAMMPVLSYLGHSAYGLPTALVSNTFNYGLFNVLDTTDYIRGTLPVWKQLGFRSDAICTGYMYSEEQAQLVSDYCREQAAGGTKIYVDPVMGDGAILFKTPTCPNCKAAMALLDRAGIAYTAVNAGDERELVEKYGVKQAPTLVLTHGDSFEKYRGVSDIKGWLMQRV